MAGTILVVIHLMVAGSVIHGRAAPSRNPEKLLILRGNFRGIIRILAINCIATPHDECGTLLLDVVEDAADDLTLWVGLTRRPIVSSNNEHEMIGIAGSRWAGSTFQRLKIRHLPGDRNCDCGQQREEKATREMFHRSPPRYVFGQNSER